MSSHAAKTPSSSQLSALANTLIPMLERAKQKHKQDYHYRYLLGTMRYILKNLQDEESHNKKSKTGKTQKTKPSKNTKI